MERLKIIAFTHKTVDISSIGKLHVEDTEISHKIACLKKKLQLEEIMYLSTCNRVEFIMATSCSVNESFLQNFFTVFNPAWNGKEINWALTAAKTYEGEEALKHLLHVASSLDSMVVGEREIITQVRNAYEKAHKLGLTGDLIRLAIKYTIETAKQIYTHTHIARKPISVVSLAYRKLKESNITLETRFLIVGAGTTNVTMAKYLKKHGFKHFTIFNRTLANAEKLAKDLGGKAYALPELKTYTGNFDVILICTGASEHILAKEIYSRLVKDNSKKTIVDLAVPSDVDPEILSSYNVAHISVEALQKLAKENMKERHKELSKCEEIIENRLKEFQRTIQERKIELAMREVPKKVKEIRENALNAIFAKDIAQLNEDSREVLTKILNYMEKKYISVPIKMAKSILMEEKLKKESSAEAVQHN